LPLKFSETGPAFPDALVNDMLEGKVVFLCGAGVSTPQLPGFKDLVVRVYKKLGMDQNAGEAEAFNANRYEEVLGSLARRLSRPQAVARAVHDLLQKADPDLARHHTLLRLSRDLLSRPTLVTTNFDTLFERAFEEVEGKGCARPMSLAGQALPPPGGGDFCGIIHLHGRLADPDRGLDPSPLVMTSSDYGDAYMRSAWASRFLFDLMRCRSLVLIGYQANDAPVRYFLNVLESDRERFEDLRDVYAFDGRELAKADQDSWSTVAVHALGFEKAVSGDAYATLWRDLDALANLIEKPRRWRRARAKAILEQPMSAASVIDLDTVAWLLRGKRDLWDVAINAITDHRWLDHFTAQKLWDDNDAAWVLASWCALDWTDRDRLTHAISWVGRFRVRFAERLEQRLWSARPTDDLVYRAWRMVIASATETRDDDLVSYRLTSRLQAGGVTDQDVQDAVDRISPRVALMTRGFEASRSSKPATRLSDFFHVRLSVEDRGGIIDLMDAVLAAAEPLRLCEIATERLRSVIAAAYEAEYFYAETDRLDENLPTVERHDQNKYQNGIVFLVQLATDAFTRVARADHAAARVLAERWKVLPSRVGRRLYLQALRNSDLYSADDVAQAILDLSVDDFWKIRRELILAMSERLEGADPALTTAINRRIIDEAPTLYVGEIAGPAGQEDWRPQVRDRNAWLRLSALKRASVLSPEGAEALGRIAGDRTFLAGDFDESDLFRNYSRGVRRLSGNPEPLRRTTEAAKRLEIVRTDLTEADPAVQQNWRAYCSADPVGALETLKLAPLVADNAGLWGDLVGSLSWSPEGEAAAARRTRQKITREIFNHLEDADQGLIDGLARGLVDLLEQGRRARLPSADAWWDRLWAACEGDSDIQVEDDATDRFYDHVINTGAGRLAEQLITQIDARKTKTRKISPENRARLQRIMASDTPAGWLGRGACAGQAGFLFFVDPTGVRRILKPWMIRDDRQGQTLRSVLVEWSRLGEKAEKALADVILRGVRESQASGLVATHVADRLVRPLFLDAVDRQKSPFSQDEVRSTLKQAAPSVLEALLDVMERWVEGSGRKPENAWRQAVEPIFEAIWPKERTYKNPLYTRRLAALCLAAGDAAPEAFDVIRPFLSPLEGQSAALNGVTRSPTIKSHPKVVLELLWAMCGPGCEIEVWQLDKALDKIAEVDESLIRDRRFQWLEQRAPRFG
jgi:hypothetical protein